MVIVGAVIVVACVLGGYVLHHGKLGVLNQPTEFLIIFGAAIGALVIANTPDQIKHILHAVTASLKKKPTSKEAYLELLMCLYELCKNCYQLVHLLQLQ